MNLNYMQCEHFTTHWRMKSYAYDIGGKHIQGFMWVRQCATCGCECKE